jgi:hypothetical protein
MSKNKSYMDYESAKDFVYGLIKEFIIKNKIKSVLDVGCGPGRLIDDVNPFAGLRV